MYEKLSDKKCMPTMEEFISHIGTCKDLFENMSSFVTNELNAEMSLRFSSDKSVRGWGLGFKSKSNYFGEIVAEKNALLIVMRLTDEQMKKAYEVVLPYAQECLNNCGRTHNGGWVQYRVSNIEELDDVKKILIIRNKTK